MSDSNKVKIKNKRTGEVSLAQTARSVMQLKHDKPASPEHAGERNSGQVQQEKEVGLPDQDKAIPGSAERPSSVKNSVKNKQSKGEINSLSAFIAYAYSRKGQTLKTLAPKEIKAVTKNACLSEREFEDILIMSKSDVLLAVPIQIILAGRQLNGTPLVRQEVRRLISEVLKQHPLYRCNNLVSVIANLDDALGPVEAIRSIATLSKQTLARLTGLQRPKPKDIEALRLNAINCLALWLWETRGTQVNRVIRWLYDGYWSEDASPETSETGWLKTVTGVTEVLGVGTACKLFKEEADDSWRRAAGLQSKIESLCEEIAGLGQAIADLEGVVQERDGIISRLSQELEAERSAHASSRAHLGDDREHLRSNAVYRLKREVSLLSEGLQALRKEPPKVRVMDDHAERVLEGLQAALKELEDED